MGRGGKEGGEGEEEEDYGEEADPREVLRSLKY